MSTDKKVVVVPCSGIGKTYGTVSREAAYEIVDELRPQDTQLVALSMLVLGDETARTAVACNPAVTIDGCKLACASKMVQASGGTVAQDFAVLDVYRRNRSCKPKGIAALNAGGLQLAHALAAEVVAVVDALQKSISDDFDPQMNIDSHRFFSMPSESSVVHPGEKKDA